MEITKPELKLVISCWELIHEFDPSTADGLRKQFEAIKEAGFSYFSSDPYLDGLKDLLDEFDFEFSGALELGIDAPFEQPILDCATMGTGPINIQLGHYDTPTDKAIERIVQIDKLGKECNRRIHIEVHRDRCTETPEKTDAIIKGCTDKLGHYPLLNFDFSHPAVFRHLAPELYNERLFWQSEVFQASNLWHARPFNGHHCQVPVSNGKDKFSPEYETCRLFFRDAMDDWLKGNRPTDTLWIVPELGTTLGYNLSCFPNIWKDTILLAHDLKSLWDELTSNGTK